MQHSSDSPAQLLSDMEKCSEIVYSLLEVEPKYDQPPARSHQPNDVRHQTAAKSQDKHSRHRKKTLVTMQNPQQAKKQHTSTKPNSKPLSTPQSRRDTPDHLSNSSSAKTLAKQDPTHSVPKCGPSVPFLSSTAASTASNTTGHSHPYSISTSSHLLSLATQRLMQTLSVRLDPSRSEQALPSDVQAILPQLMAVIQLLDATNPSPLPHPPTLSLSIPSDLSAHSRPPPLSASDLRQLSTASLPGPIRHETGTNTEPGRTDIYTSGADQLREELSRVRSEKHQLSEKCQRLESCLRSLRANRDDLSRQLSESTHQRNGLSSTLQQLRSEINMFKERNKNLSGEVNRGNQLYLSSVHSLSSSIQLLDPTFPDQSELDGISLGADFHHLREEEMELSRMRAKLSQYKNNLIRTHTNLSRCIRDTGSSSLPELYSELDNFMKSERLVDSSADVNKLSNGYSGLSTERSPSYDRHILSTGATPVFSSTLNNEAEFDERLCELDAQISKLQMHIHQSREQLQ